MPGETFLQTACPHCDGKLEFAPASMGEEIDCPLCGHPLILPHSESMPVGDAETVTGSSGITVGSLMRAFRGRVSRRLPRFRYSVALTAVGVMMLILPALYIVSVAGFGGAWFWLAMEWFHQIQEPIPDGEGLPLATAVLQIAALAFGAFILFFLVKPLFVSTRRPPTPVALDPSSEPLLFALIHLVCEAIGSVNPSRVEVDCRLNASMRIRPGLTNLIRGEGVLRVGLPLVACLSLRELAGVLAHELGHANQRAGLRASSLVRAVNTWLGRIAHGRDTWDESLETWAAGAEGWRTRSVAVVAHLGAAVSRGAFKLLWMASQAVSALLLRQMELDADRCQIGVAGSDGFERTLRKTVVLGAVAREVYRSLRNEWDRGVELPDDLPERFRQAVADVTEEHRDRWLDRAARSEGEWFDTHPTMATRLDQAHTLAVPGVFDHEAVATAVFADFAAVSREATRRHYEEVLGLRGREPHQAA